MRRPLLAPRAVWTLCHKTSLSRADHMTRPCSWWHHVFAVPWSLPMPSHLNAQEEGRWCWQRWLWQLLLPSLPRGQEDAEQLVRCGVIAAIWIQAGALLHVSSAAMAQPQGNTSPVCTGGFMYRQVLVGDRHCLWQAIKPAIYVNVSISCLPAPWHPNKPHGDKAPLSAPLPCVTCHRGQVQQLVRLVTCLGIAPVRDGEGWGPAALLPLGWGPAQDLPPTQMSHI